LFDVLPLCHVDGLIHVTLLNGSHSVLWRQVKILKKFINSLRKRLFAKTMPFGDLFHAFLRPPDQAVTVKHYVQLQQRTG
jgi:hypothetical protein